MSLKDDLRKHLTPELFTTVTDALGDDFNYDVVPRSRLNKVIGQRDKLKEELEKSVGTQQQTNSSNSSEDDDDDFVMPNGKSKSEQPNEADLRQKFENEKNEAIKGIRIQYAGLDALRAANAVDADLAFTLIDKNKLTLSEDGKLAGIAEQITTLQESKPFLFSKSTGGRIDTPSGTGKEGGSDPFETVKSKADFLKLNTTEQIKFKEAHPDVFKSYLNQ